MSTSLLKIKSKREQVKTFSMNERTVVRSRPQFNFEQPVSPKQEEKVYNFDQSDKNKVYSMFDTPVSTQYFEKTFSVMEESIKDLQESLNINKDLLKDVLSSGISDNTISATFYKITEENSKLAKANHKLAKERDIALFKCDKVAFEAAMAPSIPKSEDVRRFESKSTFPYINNFSSCSY